MDKLLNTENITIIAAYSLCLLTLVLTAFVTNSVFKNIDRIGDNKSLKKDISSKTLFNFYAVVMLTFVLFAKLLLIIDSQLFIGLFIIILGGLGFKISYEVINKSSN